MRHLLPSMMACVRERQAAADALPSSAVSGTMVTRGMRC